VRSHNMAKAMFESAIWDICAQKEKLSLQKLIAKISGHTKLKDRVSVGVSVGIQPTTAQMVKTVEGYLKDGYGRIKMKIKPGRDVQDARAVRKAIGNTMLMVDANSAYGIDEIDVIKKMDDLDLIMIEQPFAYDDIFQHSKLQKQLKTPVCLDESIHSVRDAQAMIELDAGRIINIKQGRLGGLTAAIATHDLCMQHNIPVWCGGMLETGIGRALNVALASLPNFKLPSDLSASNRYYNPDIITPEFTLNSDSSLSVPKGIGIGVKVNYESLVRNTLVHHVFRADRKFGPADTLTGVKLTGRKKVKN
jgi:o-succinylbenzoate synthase